MKLLTRCAVAVMVLALFTATVWAEGGQEQRTATVKPVVNMFMGNSGVPQPSGTDPSDNWAINIVEEYAGVDLVLEIPGYQDFTTKLNLLLASGSLPDVVHGYGAELTKAGDAGAFTNLKPFYDRSGQMQKVVTPIQMDLAKSQVTGRWWAVPMTATGLESGNGSIIRWDLLEQYNGGRFPDTVEGYIDFLRWVKNNIPDSIPLSGQTSGDRLFVISETFFRF
jgi:putative aldouronate transport system substrate-binding protein